MTKIAVCDDDIESIDHLKQLINEYLSDKKIRCEVKYYRSSKELLESENKGIDIAILDIEMDGKNGIQTGYEIQRRCPDSVIIITTAFSQYLDDAMDLRVFRFFEKPVDRDRLFRALDKLFSESPMIEFYSEYSKTEISENNIVCVFSSGRKTFLVTSDGKKITTSTSLKQWKEILKGHRSFSIPHNSYIVNLESVSMLSDDKIVLSGDNGNIMTIYASRRKLHDFKIDFYNKMGDYK